MSSVLTRAESAWKLTRKAVFNNLNEESVPEEELSEEERELLGLTEKREVLSQDERLAEDAGGASVKESSRF